MNKIEVVTKIDILSIVEKSLETDGEDFMKIFKTIRIVMSRYILHNGVQLRKENNNGVQLRKENNIGEDVYKKVDFAFSILAEEFEDIIGGN